MKRTQRTIKASLLTSAGLLWVMTLSLTSWGAPDVVEELVRVTQVVGRVEIRTNSSPKWREARAGMRVKMGWDIRTYMESDAEVQFESGTVLRIGENTIVTLSTALVKPSSSATKTSVKIATGQVWANVKKLTNQSSKFRFETPTATAAIRGTRLGINVGNEGTAVDVYEGLVVVMPRGARDGGVEVARDTRAVVTSGSNEVALTKFQEETPNDSGSVPGLPEFYDPFVEPDSAGVPDTIPGAPEDTVGDRQGEASRDSVEEESTVTQDSIAYRPNNQTLSLLVQRPSDGQRVTQAMIPVAGTAVAGAVVTVNGVRIGVSSTGAFQYQLPIPDEPQEYLLEISAELNGREVQEERRVVYEPERKPMSLTVSTPTEGQKIGQRIIRIVGTSAPEATVTMGSKQTIASASGLFSLEQVVTESDIGEYQFELTAESKDGSEELSTTVSVEIDGTSGQINTSAPSIVVQGASEQASRLLELIVSVLDRTPDDQITLVAEVNGMKEEYGMESGGRQVVALDEGKNRFTISAQDRAGNTSNMVSGETYYLPGPLAIDIVEPIFNPYVIDDLPPMPQGVGRPTVDIEVEIDDAIGDVPETIRYCKITGGTGEVVLRDNKDYTFSGTVTLSRGSNTFVITTEDIAGNTATQRLEITIRD